MRRGRRGRAGGFTLIEIMVSLAVVIIGLLGIMALQMTTVKANRLSRNVDRARVMAAQIMEDLRAKPMPLATVPVYPTISTPDGMDFVRTYAVTGVTGSTTLVLLTATVTFTDPTDQSVHTASVQLVRTNQGEFL